MTKSDLKKEATIATEILKGKDVSTVFRNRVGEFGIEFTDGTRLFVDHLENGLELSITDSSQEPANNVGFCLSKEEAIVLFEFLSRFSDIETLNIKHQAEERVLWNLRSLLEEKLSEPFDKNYQEILKAARERIKDKND